ncbi:MAG: hypothetical protein VBE63_25870, partial [Lamprobacter sp.]|uniref:crAss001_48 related protein n=1 Tax=Lamprobacter sp. TaxID=3100796 RepID=UPI002B2623C0
MKDYQQRVIAEKEDLDGKIERLATFMTGETFEALPGAERSDMQLQIGAMQEYSDILANRIGRFDS